MKRVQFARWVAVAVLMASCWMPADSFAMRVGYADMERAVAQTKAGRRAKDKIDKEVTSRQKKLESARNKIIQLEEDFKKQELVLSEDSKEKKRSEYLKKVEELRAMVGKNQQEMQEFEQKIAEPILTKMRETLQKLSKEKGYEMVVSKGVLLFADDKDDLTDALIKQFDKEYKGE